MKKELKLRLLSSFQLTFKNSTNLDCYLNFNDNVDLTDPILSRFDILTVIRDEPQEDLDDALATFVINSHMKNHPSARTIPEDEAEGEQQKQQLAASLLDESNIEKVKSTMVLD